MGPDPQPHQESVLDGVLGLGVGFPKPFCGVFTRLPHSTCPAEKPKMVVVLEAVGGLVMKWLKVILWVVGPGHTPSSPRQH